SWLAVAGALRPADRAGQLAAGCAGGPRQRPARGARARSGLAFVRGVASPERTGQGRRRLGRRWGRPGAGGRWGALEGAGPAGSRPSARRRRSTRIAAPSRVEAPPDAPVAPRGTVRLLAALGDPGARSRPIGR